jgi:hypothetical protein
MGIPWAVFLWQRLPPCGCSEMAAHSVQRARDERETHRFCSDLRQCGIHHAIARLSSAISAAAFRSPCHSRPATIASRPAITPNSEWQGHVYSIQLTSVQRRSGSVITANGTIIVGTAPSGRILTSLTVIPPSQTVYAIGETAQYIAIGTFSAAPLTLDLTNQVAWQSSDIQIGQVNSSGLVTGIGAVTLPPGAEPIATITALATASDGSIVAASGAFEELATSVVNLPTLTVYKVGSGTGTVTAGSSLSSDGTSLQGTAVINCGSGAECVGTFPAGSKVYLVAAAIAGSKFDGWSVNCPLVSPSILNVCSITMTSNSTVGAIFDPTTP